MKNTNSKLILTVLLSFAVLFLASAQKKANKERVDAPAENIESTTVKGTVTAFHNYYLNNIEVSARKSRTKAITDSLGRFEIIASNGDILVFKADGFEKNRREVALNEDEITVNMILVPGEKSQHNAIRNGHISERDLAYAAEHYSDFNNDFLKYSDIKELLEKELIEATILDHGIIQVYLHDEQELLRAEMIGPRITDRENTKSFYMRGGEEFNVSEQPVGTRISNQQSMTQIYSRGGNIRSSGFSGNIGAAIFVLDGMIVPSIDFLHPWEVKSVKLLRSTGAAKYGSQGANGVVLIHTKHM